MVRAVGLGIVVSAVIVVSVGTQAFLVIVALVFLGIVVPAFLVIAVFLVTRVQLEQEKLLPIIILSLPEI